MKKRQKKIKEFKASLDERFSDKFAIKADHMNQVVSRYRWWTNKLIRKLWYD